MAPEGALTVDMESHQVAAVATAAGVPVTVLRAVSDRCDQRIPAYLARAVTADGRPRLAPVVTGLVRAPASLGDLLVLGRSTRHALAALEAAADPLLKALSAAIAALPANPAIAAKPRSSG